MNVEKNINEWKRLANMDLLTAHHLFETCRPMPIEIICFLSQQTAEKMLKCFLVSKAIEPPKIHDLRELVGMCADIEDKFNEIYDEAILLTRYGVMPRYPMELELDESNAETALKYADKIMNFVSGRISCGD